MVIRGESSFKASISSRDFETDNMGDHQAWWVDALVDAFMLVPSRQIKPRDSLQE